MSDERASEVRDRQLGEYLDALGPGRLEALDGVWDLCASDLHGLVLWRTGSRSDTEDALQEVFLKLARLAEAGRLQQIRRPFAYLLRMAHSAAIDVLRRRGRRRDDTPLDEDAPLFFDPALDRVADARRVSGEVGRLPEGQRAVVYLKHFVGLSFREIGGVMRIPTFTAASRYRLALGRLRRQLGVPS